MNSNLKNDLFFLFVGRFVNVLVALVSLRVATTWLSLGEYGIWSLLVTFQTLCGLLFINPIGQYINRHTHEWHEQGVLLNKLRRYQGYVVVVAVAGLTCYAIWQKNTTQWDAVLTGGLSVAAMVVAGTWNATTIPMLNMLGERKAAAGLGVFSVGLGLAVSWVGVYIRPEGAVWLAGQAVGLGIGAMLAWHCLAQRSLEHLGEDRSTQRLELISNEEIRIYCMPLAATTGLMWFQLSGYRLWVDKTFGLPDLAMLAVGVGLTNQVFALVETLAMQYVFPHFYQAISQRRPEYSETSALSDMLELIVPVYLLLAMVVLLAAPTLLMLFTNSQYHSGYKFVMIGVGMELFRVISNLLGQAAQVTKRTSSTLPPYVIGAIVLMVGGWAVGDPPIASLEISATYLILVAAVTSISMWVWMRQQVSFKLNWVQLAHLGLLLSIISVFSVIHPLLPTSLLEALGMASAFGVLFLVGMWRLFSIQSQARRLLRVPLPKGRSAK